MPAIVLAAVQPLSGASITENTSRLRPATAMRAPTMSMRGASGSADSGTNLNTPIRATPPSTTLRPNTDCHSQNSSKAPDTSRPRIAAPPATAAHTLTALTRSDSGNVPVIVESVAGITRAAPMPITARRPISSFGPPAVIATASRGEDREPRDQREPASVAVAERAGGEQQRRERERVGVDDPLELGGARVGVLRDLGIAVLSDAIAATTAASARQTTAVMTRAGRCGAGMAAASVISDISSSPIIFYMW